MTPSQQKLFKLFPEGETVRRQDIQVKNKGHWDEKAFKHLLKTQVLVEEGIDDDGQYIRRRTVEEIREIYFNK